MIDSYYSRSQKGFKMGGRTPYGYRKEPFVLDGIRTQRFVIEPTEAAFVQQMYEMYAKPEVSYRDVVKVMEEQGVRTYHDKALGFEGRRLVVNGLISSIKATSENVQIEWKI